jgi:hypothetical protein
MKNIILIAAFLVAALGVQAQKNIPEIVKTNFKAMFSTAEKAKFSKEKDGSFEVDFKQNTVTSSAKFSAKGDWLETEQHLKKADLPAPVLDLLAKEYNGWDVETCEKVQTSDKGTFYEVFVEKGKENFELKIDTSGKVFEKTKAKKSEDKDDDDDKDDKKDDKKK